VLTDARYGFISGAVKQAVHVDRSDRVHLSESIDKVLTDRLLGPAVLMLILYLVYMFTFQASEPLVKGCQALFQWLGTLAGDLIPEGLLRSLIVSGIINGVGVWDSLSYCLHVSGHRHTGSTGCMARIAFALDRCSEALVCTVFVLALMVAGGSRAAVLCPESWLPADEGTKGAAGAILVAPHELRGKTSCICAAHRRILCS
jgi:ferrous iron transport protein B